MASTIPSRRPTWHPLLRPTAPAGIEIRYDDRPMPIAFRNGKAFVAEPEQGQVVTLVLKRKATDRLRYGGVLKVNGENMLHRQRQRDSDCSKWILEPAAPPIVVRRNQVDDKTAQEIRALGPVAIPRLRLRPQSIFSEFRAG